MKDLSSWIVLDRDYGAYPTFKSFPGPREHADPSLIQGRSRSYGTFYYEWSVIRGNRPYRWTIWVRTEQLFLAFGRHFWSLGLIYLCYPN